MWIYAPMLLTRSLMIELKFMPENANLKYVMHRLDGF